MNYKNYDIDVVQRYGVILEGWPSGIRFTNPSDIGNSLSQLTTLRDAIVSGECKFRKMTTTEKEAHQKSIDERVASGQLVPTVRKPRKDTGRKRAGQKRSRAEISDSEVADSDMDTTSGVGDAAASEPVAARAGKRHIVRPSYPQEPDSGEEADDDFVPAHGDAGSDADGVEAGDVGIEAGAPSTSLHTATVTSLARRGPSPRGEIIRNATGRRVFSATPPVNLVLGARTRTKKVRMS